MAAYAPTMAPRIHLGAVSDWYRGTGGNQLAMVCSQKTKSDSWGKKLTHSRDETDTESSKESTGEEKRNGSGSGLKDDTKVENPGRDHESRTTTEGIDQERGSESTEESTGY